MTRETLFGPVDELTVDVEAATWQGVHCPRELEWKQLSGCLDCRHHGGTIASRHGLEVVCEHSGTRVPVLPR